LRNDIELFVDVEQLVAERGKNDTPDISARQRRIEDIGVLRKPDAKRSLRTSKAG
jgi:hypothetical protein